ncbi:hypothetical protein [Myxococcus xanthus]|uniref:hypothetical protein n=1 Tax=Myxococcus xanthus TaxID=34 RepID=UPI001F2DBEFE|nr:hypothetical protein [Myxococcus xanthus]
MNLDAALKAAEKTASTVVGTSTLPCAEHRTGLLVLVYRTDTQEMLGQVQVSLSGRAIRLIPPVYDPHRSKSMQPKGRVLRYAVDDMTAATQGDGVARFLPLDAGAYTVTVDGLSAVDDLLLNPGAREQPVLLNTCPVCLVPVEVGARPEFLLQWKHDAAGVSGVELMLGDAYPLAQATGTSGLAGWSGEPLVPGSYPLALRFAGGGKFQLYSATGQLLDAAPVLDIPAGRPHFHFQVQRLGQFKLAVQLQRPDGTTAPVDRPHVTVQWPPSASPKEWVLDQGVSADIPLVNGPQTALTLDALELEDDGAPEVFEFIALNP